ncbi:formate dehydrogenase accessory sulfurtransferase FdhD [Pseudoduganella namucuonensis]|uniref:Sulfur carrier protein FdhD n=1 Tax=Pseudoduganella namucuonensis TaxID=1035707 RepID=A0A1I7M6Z0_9BURK|nr:formate dehydrogenase accessory sulfurtransferase FdhD [Pseudoduganella namucuonensis]SFV17712.1 FdhD protein [Pseudoduganella namucuonensis]
MSCALDELPGLADAPTTSGTVSRYREGDWSTALDELAEEVPVALEYNGVSHAVMMATPADLEQFALGFSLSEGIIPSVADFYGAEVQPGAAGVTVHIEIGAAAFAGLKERRRNMAGRTGCGLCGVDSLAQVFRPLPRLAASRVPSAAAIRAALLSAKALQPMNGVTGAIHAALWCGADGLPRMAFEDVGRHNALDKLIGGLARSQLALDGGFALITSRASVEMVQKAALCGIGVLVAMSAPTGLAVRVARQCGMTLVAFARGERFTVYTSQSEYTE